MHHLGDRDVTAPLPRVIVCMALLGGKARINVRPAFLSAGRPADCCFGMPNVPHGGRPIGQPCLPTKY